MPTLQYHFRRHILSTATKGVGNLPGVHPPLGQSKISNFNMPIMPNQPILRLQIPVDNILLMQVHQPIKNLNKVESSMLFTHSLDRFKVVE